MADPTITAPVVSTSGGPTAFVEGDNSFSANVVIDAGLTVSDMDSGTLASATVSIVGNFISGQDLLIFINNNTSTYGNIVASYNGGTGELTLTSAGMTATIAQWQAALRSVAYTNSSETPNPSTRVISFTANDGWNSSAATTKNVSITSTNDTPIISALSNIVVTEDVASALTGISFSDADAGSLPVTVTFSVARGRMTAISGGGVTVGGTSSSMTLTGTIADIYAFIAGGNLAFIAPANDTGNITLDIAITDSGNTGSDGAKTAQLSTTLQVAAVNDAPGISAPVLINVNEDQPALLTGISFFDPDASNGLVTVTLSVVSGVLSATSQSYVSVTGSGSGTLMLSGTIADINTFIASGQVGYRTSADATSNVVLSVQIDDLGNVGSGGAKTVTGTVTLVVTAVNDAPVNHVPANQVVEQDSNLVFASAYGNLVSISDVDAGGSTLSVTLTATYGLITLGGTTGLTFLVGSGTGDSTMIFVGSLSDINTALNGMVFSPTAGYRGSASLQIVTNDQGYSGAGGAKTDADTIAIRVGKLEPVVTSLNVTNANGIYKAGETILVTVTFDQTVTVDTNGGVPSLLLETGNVDRSATYASGSGSNTLVFAYTVQQGDASPDLDYHSVNALSLNGATIRNAMNEDAVLVLPAPGSANSIAVQHAIVIATSTTTPPSSEQPPTKLPSEPPVAPSGPIVTPNNRGGHDITITDPSQLTAALGTKGIDHVFYGGSGMIVLPGNIENITLTGDSAQATGNGLANELMGSDGDNVLRGLVGKDKIMGGAGNDRISAGSGNDSIQGGSGNDWINASSGKDTVKGDSGDDRLDGASGDDRIYGGSGNDWIYGGLGNDRLWGQGGQDVFVFNTKLKRTNVDKIHDFNTRDDAIALDNAIFTKLGRGSSEGVPLQADKFVLGSKAQDAEDRIIYDRRTGALYYDADGTGAAAQVQFSTISNKSKLTYHDFFVI